MDDVDDDDVDDVDDDDDDDDAPPRSLPAFDSLNKFDTISRYEGRHLVSFLNPYSQDSPNPGRAGCRALLLLALTYLAQHAPASLEGVTVQDAEAFVHGVDAIVVECAATREHLMRETMEDVQKLVTGGCNETVDRDSYSELSVLFLEAYLQWYGRRSERVGRFFSDQW